MTKIRRTITGAAILSIAVLLLVSARASASAAEIADIPWDEPNIATVRSASVTDVEKLLCGNERPCGVNVDRFEWADLEGKGKYALVCFFDLGGKVQTVKIYQRDASGKINEQSIDLEGYGHEDSQTNPVRDLNGDGKKELIINSGFGEGRDMAETPLTQWPLVYRLQDGQYVEASREFPRFYDKEVLPPLEKQIVEIQEKLNSEVEAKASGEALMKEYHWYEPDIVSHRSTAQAQTVEDSEHLAVLQRLRNHILLALGRRLTTDEEKEPRDWLKSSNETLVWYAEDAFEDMGDHAADVREAKQALARMNDDFNKAAEEKRSSPASSPPPVAPGN